MEYWKTDLEMPDSHVKARDYSCVECESNVAGPNDTQSG